MKTFPFEGVVHDDSTSNRFVHPREVPEELLNYSPANILSAAYNVPDDVSRYHSYESLLGRDFLFVFSIARQILCRNSKLSIKTVLTYGIILP